MSSTVATRENVAELYVATYNRAPLDEGLDYWVNDSGLDLENIAKSFFDQEETQEKYPPGTSNEDFVDEIFMNMFGHEAEGTYWEDELDSGAITRDQAILAIAGGATGDDKEILDNKTEVGLYYAASGLDSKEYSLADITKDDATVQSHEDEIYDTSTTFTLTPASDSVEEGAVNTFTLTATTVDFSAVGDNRTGVREDSDVEFTLNPGDGTAVDAGTSDTNVNDFAALSFNPVTVTIAAGDTTAEFDVTAVIDDASELVEGYSVDAEVGAQYAVTDYSADAEVLDVLPPVTFAISTAAASVLEGSDMVFTVTADRAVDVDTEVTFEIVPSDLAAPDAGTNDTNANDQITAVTSVTVTIAAGDTEATFTANALLDTTVEETETYSVVATVNDGTATTTLTADMDLEDLTSAPKVLTADVDTIDESASQNDVIVTGKNNDLNAGDAVTGNDNHITEVKLSLDGALASSSFAGFNFDNIQKFEVTNDSTQAATFDLSDSSFIDVLAVSNSTHDVTFNEAAAENNTVNLDIVNQTTSEHITLDIRDGDVMGTEDTVNILVRDSEGHLSDAGDVTIDSGVEKINFGTHGSAHAIALDSLTADGANSFIADSDVEVTIPTLDLADGAVADFRLVDARVSMGLVDTGTIHGTEYNDTLNGLGEDDDYTVYGYAGDDEITTLGGDDTLNGGDGADTIKAGAGNDTIFGGDGADTIKAGAGNDTTHGDAGNDTISFGTGEDDVFGDEGNDIINDNSSNLSVLDNITGGAGTDTLNVGTQNSDDRMLNNVTEVETINLQTGTYDIDIDHNSKFALDSATATTINASTAGSVKFDADQVQGRGLTLIGSNGSDEFTGTQQNDVFDSRGTTGDDTFTANNGDDIFQTRNTFTAADTFAGGDGTDTLEVYNRYDILTTATLSDGVTGVEKIDVKDENYNGNVKIKFTDTYAQEEIVINAEDLDSQDNLTVDAQHNNTDEDITVFAGDANDNIYLGLGDDEIHGGAGHEDIYFTNAANGFNNQDIVAGGNGWDELYVADTHVIDDDFDQVTSVEELSDYAPAPSNDYHVTLGKNAENAGIATVDYQGIGGELTLRAGDYVNTDLKVITSGNLNDDITTGGGDDDIYAAGGNDIINSGDGDDTIHGVRGANDIETGAGDDTVLVELNGSPDDLLDNDFVDGGTGDDTVNFVLANNNTNNLDNEVNLTNIVNVENFTFTNNDTVGLGNPYVTQEMEVRFTNGTVSSETEIEVEMEGFANGDKNDKLTIAIDTSDANYKFDILGSENDDTVIKENVGVHNDINFEAGKGHDTLIIDGEDFGSSITYNAENDGAEPDTVNFDKETWEFTGGDALELRDLDGNKDAVVDDGFTHLFNVEALRVNDAGAKDVTIGSAADTAGIRSIDASTVTAAGKVNVAVDAGFASNLDIYMGEGKEGYDGETLGYTGNMNVHAQTDTISGTDVIKGGSGTNVLNLTADDGSANLSGISGFHQINVTTDQDVDAPLPGIHKTAEIKLGTDTFADASNTLIVDAREMDHADNKVTFNGTAETDGNIEITTGAGSDDIKTGGGNDTVTAGEGDNTVRTNAGDDTVTTGSGRDDIKTGAGEDDITAGAGNDTIDAGDDNDTIDAGEGDDNIDAGKGDDTITAGEGEDVVFGGAGADMIDLSEGTAEKDILTYSATKQSNGLNMDIVDGFNANDDVMNFSGISALDHEIDYLGSVADYALVDAALTGTVGEAVVTEDNGRVYIDVDGSGDVDSGDMVIQLNGITDELTNANFTVVPLIFDVTINDGGDDWINAAEDDAVTVSGDSTGANGETLTVDLTDESGHSESVDAIIQGDGTWTTDPADLSGFTSGDVITATANVTNTAGHAADPATDTSNLDNVDPTLAISFNDTGAADGTETQESEISIDTATDADSGVASTTYAINGVAYTAAQIAALADDDYTGANNIDVTLTDAAGNETVQSVDLIKDTVTSVATPGLDDDTGIDNGDYITSNGKVTAVVTETNNTLSTTYTVTYAGVDTVFDDKAALDTHMANLSSGNDATDDGEYSIVATTTDLAGNEDTSNVSITYTLDTYVAAPDNVQMDPGSDTGSSHTDNITGNNRPTFESEHDGSVEGGALIEVSSDKDGVLGTVTAQDEGTWQYVIPAGEELSDNDHVITVKQTDIAGNESIASDPLNITIDTAAPDAPTFVLHEDTWDGHTGGADSDFRTYDATIDVTLAEAGGSWEYRYNADGAGFTAWTEGTGTSFDLHEDNTEITVDYDAGDIEVRQIDTAGNIGAIATNTDDIKIDTSADSNGNLAMIVDADEYINTLESDNVDYEIQGVDSDASEVDVKWVSDEGGEVNVDRLADGNNTVTDDITVDANNLKDGVVTATITVMDETGNTKVVAAAFEDGAGYEESSSELDTKAPELETVVFANQDDKSNDITTANDAVTNSVAGNGQNVADFGGAEEDDDIEFHFSEEVLVPTDSIQVVDGGFVHATSDGTETGQVITLEQDITLTDGSTYDYEVDATGSDAVTDLAGNPLEGADVDQDFVL